MQVDGPVRILGAVTVAGTMVLLGAAGAASRSLLPGQLDSAGRQACSRTLGMPGTEQRAEAVALARRSDERGLRDAAGRAGSTPSDAHHRAVAQWCASND